jgi:AcrR family transcriptional regulator
VCMPTHASMASVGRLVRLFSARAAGRRRVMHQENGVDGMDAAPEATSKVTESMRDTTAERRNRSPRVHRHPTDRPYPSFQGDLAPAARRLLEAARALLSESGFTSLTVEAIARVAGERKSLIHYYFGGKNGLLVALADWLMYDLNWDIRARVAALPIGEERLSCLVDDLARVASDRTAQREFFELLPHLVANGKMRSQLADLYLHYRAMLERALPLQPDGVSSAQLSAVARMGVALVDGYAVQLLLAPESSIGKLDTDLWELALKALLTHEATPAHPANRSAVPGP